jgi:predicted dehydrogenase
MLPNRFAKSLLLSAVLAFSFFTAPAANCQSAGGNAGTAQPLRVAIIGLVHDHVQGFLQELPRHSNVQLVGIVESDRSLTDRYEQKFHLDHSLFFTSIDAMIDREHPAALLVYTSIANHRPVIENAARRGVNVMVEKPLSTTLADALAIRQTAREHHIQVLVNYETTWYASNHEAYREVQQGKLGIVRRVDVHDGHRGPKEIGVGPEFFGWLTDPEQNGAGALFDFGCYGADLMTWLMHGQAPLSVTAVIQTDKPEIYPKVDDEATVILKYPGAQAILQASWNWPFDRKDMEVYGATGYAITVGRDDLRVRYAGEAHESQIAAPPLDAHESSSLDYLVAALRGEIKPEGDLTALDTNIVVMQILDAARESARSGRTVELKPLPK